MPKSLDSWKEVHAAVHLKSLNLWTWIELKMEKITQDFDLYPTCSYRWCCQQRTFLPLSESQTEMCLQDTWWCQRPPQSAGLYWVPNLESLTPGPQWTSFQQLASICIAIMWRMLAYNYTLLPQHDNLLCSLPVLTSANRFISKSDVLRNSDVLTSLPSRWKWHKEKWHTATASLTHPVKVYRYKLQWSGITPSFYLWKHLKRNIHLLFYKITYFVRQDLSFLEKKGAESLIGRGWSCRSHLPSGSHHKSTQRNSIP